ncbi:MULTISPECIES: hypothetical protein [Eggerthella]|uniref:hypothetical protein n=1 Tax=Eggerthella TaxID=84111 RepID=UPI0011C0587C|nr:MULTISPECIES: hypothetical protein [Eggerthella]MDB1739899.1 hypothetical protein [Eggerthella lenta]MDB1742449.1 hypothetical protein [Eggerthella lenta]MDU5918273.1 hypothetical protein [Eggerthella sp.]
MLYALGFTGVFCAPPSAGFCAEPIVVTQGHFAREARLTDGSERGRVDVGVLVCREGAGAAEAVCLAAERSLRGAAWPIDVDGVRIASADSDGSGPRGRDGSGRWLWGFTLICTVVRHVG